MNAPPPIRLVNADDNDLPGPISRRFSEIQPEVTDWLCPGRIPFGKLTVLEGDPGLGKSTFLIDVAARLSRGEGLPGDPPIGASDVILLTAEDGLGDTVRPRLDSAGADCSRVHTLDAYRQTDGLVREIQLGDRAKSPSLAALEELVIRTGARLVVFDVLAAFLSGKTDSYRDQDIRAALRPLSELAERRVCAIVVVRHLRKAIGGNAISAGGGSIGIAGAARSVLLIAADPEDETHRVLASVKCNLAPLPRSLSFCFSVPEAGGSRIEWLGECDHTAESLTKARGSAQNDEGRLSKVELCAEALEEWLMPGEMERQHVLSIGKQNGFNEKLMERAFALLRGVSVVTGFGAERRSVWSLAPTPTPFAITDNALGPSPAVGDGPDVGDVPLPNSDEEWEPMDLEGEGFGGATW